LDPVSFLNFYYFLDKEELSVIEESGSGSTAEVDSPGAPSPKEHPIYRVPRLPKLPSEGVQYDGIAGSQIRQLVHKLTMLIRHRVRRYMSGRKKSHDY